MQKKLWICDRCKAEDPADSTDAMPPGWSKFHRYAPSGLPTTPGEHRAEYVYDLCADCIEAFVGWMQGVPVDESDPAATRCTYECPNHHTWTRITANPPEWATCPRCGRPGTQPGLLQIPRLAEDVMTR
jgi:hypothetical protein